LISFNDQGEVEIYNNAASELLNTPVIHKISELNRVHEGFGDRIVSMTPDQAETVRLKVNNDLRVVSLRVVEFKFESKQVKLVSLQNITPELEQGEIEAWQKLTRVMAHEIINSVSPITLLSSTMLQGFEADKGVKSADEIKDDQIETSVQSLKAIKKRSQGLAKFVESYRNIAKIPEPKLSTFPIKELFEQVHILLKKDLESKQVGFEFKIYPESLNLTADEKLMEQVLINLVRNAIDAVAESENPTVIMKAFESDDEVLLKVMDNGGGIPLENMDNIFVPFFTTKDTGSGIGLSFSRQIMRAHKGKILAFSQPGNTEFTLVF
jgi:nitrogen fixation/metabolism regulation signal transduction histidine kinase